MNDFDFLAFLAARLDEHENAARNAAPAPWTHDYVRHGALVVDGNEETVADPGYRWSDRTHLANGWHIELHDPAYVLADIAAKRAILERHQSLMTKHQEHRKSAVIAAMIDVSLSNIKDLCRPFADHDDWPGE